MSDRKPRLGLTQRVTIIEEYGERRDCLDQAWTTLLEEWGYQPVPLPNTIADVNTYLESLDLDGIVLTSGNDLAHLEDAIVPAPERDEFESAVLDWALDRSRPCPWCLSRSRTYEPLFRWVTEPG
jgi:Predicted glutamine amidotransferases